MGNILVAVILIALLIPAVKSSIKHFKGKGGCCGGSAVVTLSSPVDDALLKQAVEGADYTVTAIEQ